ncbi:MAG: type 4a pilus biogenesis protein PilO [candidate division KSB1 bacterium]|nr:type 4a pilus biogenesis protein PilO [candidate division KSB1 bacterium]
MIQGLFCVFLLISGKHIIYPMAQHCLTLMKQIQDNNYKLAQIHEEHTLRPLLEKDQDRLNEKLRDIRINTTMQNDLSSVLRMIAVACKESGVYIRSIIPGRSEPVSTYHRIPIKLDIHCRYHPLGQFINFLERSDHVIEIRKLIIDSDGIFSSALESEIELYVYFFERSD